MKLSIHLIKRITNIILIFIILVANTSFSQRKGGGFGFFSAGYQTIDIKGLNKQLKLFNYPEFDRSFLTIGGGGFGIVNDYVIGGEGHGFISSDLSNQFYQTNLMAGYGLFDLGYIVYTSKNLIIFPLIGFGGGGIDVRINEKSLVDFDSVLINPKRGSVLSNAGLMLNFGLNFIYHLNLSEEGSDKGGISLGVNLGYLQFFKIGNWTLFDTEIARGPDVGLSGFYFRFTIGGGGSSDN